jgi:PII-like signaling protein
MMGYQLTFYTNQDRKYQGVPLGEWLVLEAKRMAIGGATLFGAAQGFGHAHVLHSSHFFELADQPMVVTLILDELDKNKLFSRLQELDLKLFYVCAKVEFGVVGE